MAGRALRWFDVPVALGLMTVGHLAITQAFGDAGRGGTSAARVVAVAMLGGMGTALLALLSSRYLMGSPWGPRSAGPRRGL